MRNMIAHFPDHLTDIARKSRMLRFKYEKRWIARDLDGDNGAGTPVAGLALFAVFDLRGGIRNCVKRRNKAFDEISLDWIGSFDI
jgi:hypothetical protein